MGDTSETKPRFRLPLRPVVLALIVAGVAANLPSGWFGAQSEAERRAEVFSEFVARAGAAEGAAPVFMQSIASLTGQAARARQAWGAHMQGDVLAGYAKAVGQDEAALRDAMRAPGVAHPFDLSAFRLDQPSFDRRGMAGAWHWGLVQTGTADIAPDAAVLRWCAQWLVIWDETRWFYAPVGTKALDALWAGALPEMAEAALPQVQPCEGGA